MVKTSIRLILTNGLASVIAGLCGSPVALANVVGTGQQNFNSIPDGLDFVTVQSSETLKPGIFNLGIFANNAINTLPYFQSGAQGRTRFNDSLLGLDMNLGVGLGANWEAGISMPFILRQTVEANQILHGQFMSRGNTEIRAMSKYRLLGDDAGGLALVGSVNFDRTRDNPYAGVSPGPTLNFEVAADTTIRKFALGANLGFRKTNPGANVPGSPIAPTGNQFTASVAGSYLLPRIDTKAIVEIFGSRPAKNASDNANRQASSMELLAGIKHDLNHNLALHAGGGTELLHGVSSPDWRIYAGANFTFGPVFTRDQELVKSVRNGAEERLITHSILFEFDSDSMTMESERALSEVIQRLSKAPFKKIVVAGHTDSIGSEEYNQELSRKRSTVIRRYLVEQGGIDPSKIEPAGRGESEPVADNGNFQGRQENRRVEFIVHR